VAFEPEKESIALKGAIRFVNGTAGSDPKYAINFTIAKLSDGVYRSLEFEYGQSINDFNEPVTMEAGDYYLVTGNRQADGSVLSSLTFFVVPENKTVDVPVTMRESFEPQQTLGTIVQANYTLIRYSDSKTLNISDLSSDKGVIFIWIDPDKEPSKHVLADIPTVRSVIEKWNGGLTFLLTEGKVTPAFSPESFKGLPAQSIFAFDHQGKLLETISKIKGMELHSNLPVIVISDADGNLLFYSQGYKIGIGEQLAKEINRMK
jgi:hypothetical protein